jgi:carbon monoxide dehydrogenase subunit G
MDRPDKEPAVAKMSVSKQTHALPDRVWQVITDIDGSAEVLSNIKAIERVDSGSGFGVGTRWRETREMFGRESTEEMEVTSLEEGRSYTVEARNRGVHYQSVVSVEPSERGSLITMTFEAEPSGMLGKVLAATLGKLFAGATKKALAKDLDEIASAAAPTH